MKRVKKGARVLVTWLDICADLHSTELIEPAEAETLGWVESFTKKFVRIITSRYKDDRKLADRIVIPRGCIESIEEV